MVLLQRRLQDLHEIPEADRVLLIFRVTPVRGLIE